MKLTMAQAVIRYLNNQYIQRDEKKTNSLLVSGVSLAMVMWQELAKR